jgi:hypothetical protein
MSAQSDIGLVRLTLRDGVDVTTLTIRSSFEAIAEALVAGDALVRIDPLGDNEATIVVVARFVQALAFEPGPS